MLSELEATSIVRNTFPTSRVEPPIAYRGVYLFMVFNDDDPLEGDQDPFFSVEQSTGELRDFSIITDGDPNEITNLFLIRQQQR
jgi:hypothetical protein